MYRRAKRLRQELEQPTPGVDVLQSLLGVGGISRQGLSKLLKTLAKDCLDLESVDLQFANTVFFESVKHVEELPMNNGDVFRWEMCHPCRLIAAMVSESPQLEKLFTEVANKRRASEWSLMIAFDEYVPGDYKRPESNRKSMNLIFTFLDFGAKHLCHDELWFIPISARSVKIADVTGGWSHMFTRFLDIFLWGPSGIATAGVALALNGSP